MSFVYIKNNSLLLKRFLSRRNLFDLSLRKFSYFCSTSFTENIKAPVDFSFKSCLGMWKYFFFL